jgi:hypothetical protein
MTPSISFGRAVAEQLEGDEEEHAKYRKMVVDYLQVKILNPTSWSSCQIL